jgi:hypothetical protein
MFAANDCEVFACGTITVLFIRSLNVYELPAEIWKPEDGSVEPNVKSKSAVLETVEVASPAVTTLLPFASISVTLVVLKSVVVAALPVKVILTFFRTTPPALFAVNVMVPMSSGFDFACVLPPRGAVATVRVLRRTVIVLPGAPVFGTIDTVDERLDVEPKAVTSVVFTTLKVWPELSVTPPEDQVDASPFRVSETEFACGTMTGFAKWNA